MLVKFELHKRGLNHEDDVLVHCLEEDCHVDMIERRAKTLLWTVPLDDRQDLVIVRRAADGGEIFRRAIGTAYRARAS